MFLPDLYCTGKPGVKRRSNPLTLPIEQARNAVIWGVTPDLIGLVVYTMIALGVAVLGYLWFQKTRKGFADVI